MQIVSALELELRSFLSCVLRVAVCLVLEAQHKVRQERTKEAMPAPSITTPMAIGRTERVVISEVLWRRRLEMVMRTPALTAQMTDISRDATTRHLFFERAPPIASPPQMKKTAEMPAIKLKSADVSSRKVSG